VGLAEWAATVVEIVVFIGWAVVMLLEEVQSALEVAGVFAFAAYAEGAVVGMLDVLLAERAAADTTDFGFWRCRVCAEVNQESGFGWELRNHGRCWLSIDRPQVKTGGVEGTKVRGGAVV
jgi:hypothetical protein